MSRKHELNARPDSILIVDDETASLRLLTDILSSKGYRVRPTERPRSAIESAMADPPSLILLDVKMPEMSGFEVCRRLKQEERTKDIPVIFVSGLQDIEDRVRGFEAGGVDFISKPFQEAEILARVNTHLQLYRMQMHLGNLVDERTSELMISNKALKTEIDRRKKMEAGLEAYQKRLKALASQLVISEENERTRIAADLHDDIGQTLAFSRIQIAGAKKYAPEGELATLLDEISQSLLDTIQSTKELIFDLSSPLLNEIGLAAAISNWLENQVGGKNAIKEKFVYSGKELSLKKELRSILFRNVRELLSNVIKHAQAKEVTVTLVSDEGKLEIIVHDDGIGFDYNSKAAIGGVNSGFGLFSVKQQIEDFGGKLEVISKPGKGCKAILTVPMRV